MHGKHPRFIVHDDDPFNGELPLAILTATETTPNNLFFSRNHGNIPHIDPNTYQLTVDGLIEAPRIFTLADLDRFPRHTQVTTLECAGNRRYELDALAPIHDELPWGNGAISTAVWSGVRLIDVLADANVQAGAAHVAFEGLDTVEREGAQFGFGGSIPIRDVEQVLLADTMNGEPLPAAHGAPLRAIVSGIIGARSVKWLSRITLQQHPSDNYFQQQAYQLYPPAATKDTHAQYTGIMLNEVPLTSVITSPDEYTTPTTGSVVVRGYAVAGGQHTVARVDVSADDGMNWVEAFLFGDAVPGVWRRWEATLMLSAGEHMLVCRAWDNAARSQPEHAASLWNYKGYMNNAYHRVRVRVME